MAGQGINDNVPTDITLRLLLESTSTSASRSPVPLPTERSKTLSLWSNYPPHAFDCAMESNESRAAAFRPRDELDGHGPEGRVDSAATAYARRKGTADGERALDARRCRHEQV